MDKSQVEAEEGLALASTADQAGLAEDGVGEDRVQSEGVAEEGWLQEGLRHHAVEAGVAAGALRGGDDASGTRERGEGPCHPTLTP